MSTDPISKRIIVALDYASVEEAGELCEAISPRLCRIKIGKELFTNAGPALVKSIVDRGFDVFLDLKFHDIPTTVAKAVRSALDLGVWMLNVHALGGERMMEAARAAAQGHGSGAKLIAVTVLTSMRDDDLQKIGIQESAEQLAKRLAALAHQCELDGVVCSPREAGMIMRAHGADFLRVTPGIRASSRVVNDDQQRTMSAREAACGGSSYLVVGRPITQASDPCAALLALRKEIGEH